MKTGTTTGRISRAVVSLAAAAAIFAGIAGGMATSTGEADAALKWREEAVKWTVKPAKCKDKDTTCVTTTDSTTTTP